jgi:hypothetical protein
MNFKEVVAEWKRQRREFIIELKRKESLSNDKIGKRYGITRQAVGLILAGK